MGFIEDLIRRKKERSIKEIEFEDTDKAISNIERKKLSHNEREMIGILNREKEANLKEALRYEEKRRVAHELLIGREMMSGGFNLLQ